MKIGYVYVLTQHWPNTFKLLGAYVEENTAKRQVQLILNRSLVTWEENASGIKAYGPRKECFFEIYKTALFEDWEV